MISVRRTLITKSQVHRDGVVPALTGQYIAAESYDDVDASPCGLSACTSEPLQAAQCIASNARAKTNLQSRHCWTVALASHCDEDRRLIFASSWGTTVVLAAPAKTRASSASDSRRL
jgi:hypothetical protein